MEAGIFNGQGGIYFGLLDGATSSRAPAITNGVFSPVLELGVGLMLGVGRTFEKGPLSAGLYVDLLAIFGRGARLVPPDGHGRSDGDVLLVPRHRGIVGKLYGSIDFKIISVSVSVEAHAIVTLTLEAYQATLVELDVGVEVDAEVHFLFFTVSFSFSLQLQTSFEIGTSSTPPWIPAPARASAGSGQPAKQAYAQRRRRPVHVMAHTRRAFLETRAAGRFPPAEGARARCRHGHRGHRLSPGLQPGRQGLSRSGRAPGHAQDRAGVHRGQRACELHRARQRSDQPEPRLSHLVHAGRRQRGIGRGRGAAGARRPTVYANAHAGTPADVTFNQVAEGMLRWSLNAMGVTDPGATVTLGQLQELVDQLAYPEASASGFTYDMLGGFLENNLHFILSGVPSGGSPLQIGGVAFPMIPAIAWQSQEAPGPVVSTRFWEYQPVDTNYEAEALAYFADLDPRRDEHRPSLKARLAAAADSAPESMATFVFRDYFLLVARAAAQAAVDLLTAFPHPVSLTDSLASIAAGFLSAPVSYVKQPGDTVEQVAAHFGMSVAELLAFNSGFAATLAAAAPGTTLMVSIGVTPESIAGANPGWPVVASKAIPLGSLSAQILSTDTLTTVAARYQVPLDAWLSSAKVLDARPLLRSGAALPLTSFSCPNPRQLPVDTIAAIYFTRLPVPNGGEPIPWSIGIARRSPSSTRVRSGSVARRPIR